MAVKIKLMRLGKIRSPHYRVVVADARTRRDGRAIETIGKYHPKEEPSLIEIDSERAQYWLGVGALPTEPVENLLKITGDWQKFKGLPGAEGTLRTAEPGRTKLELFQAALAQAGEESAGDATTAKKKAPKKAADPKADEPAAKTEKPDAKADEPAAEAKADDAKTDEPEAKADEPAAEAEKA